MADAVHVSDLVMQDEIGKLRDTDELTPAAAEALVLAAGRAHALAQASLNAGIDVDAGELVAEERGERITAALTKVARALVESVRAPSQDWAALEAWVLEVVPLALRDPEFVLPPAPVPWRMTFAPALESGHTFRRRESELVSAALSGSVRRSEGRTLPSDRSGAGNGSDRDSGRSGNGSGRVESPQERDRRRLREAGLLGGSLVPRGASPYGRRS